MRQSTILFVIAGSYFAIAFVFYRMCTLYRDLWNRLYDHGSCSQCHLRKHQADDEPTCLGA